MIYVAKNRIIGATPKHGIYRPFQPMGASTPPPWAPNQKSGLLFWYKADVGVTAVAGIIAAWADQSGNGHTAVASGTSGGPTLNLAVQNGKPGVSFPPNTALSFGGTTNFFTNGTDFSLVVIAKDIAEVGTYYHVMCSLLSPTGNFVAFTSNDPTYQSVAWQNANFVALGGNASIKGPGDYLSAANSLVINYGGGTITTPASWNLFENNTAQTPLSNAANLQVNPTTSRIGVWYDGEFNYTGNLFEIFAYPSVLSPAELIDVQTYAASAARWAL